MLKRILAIVLLSVLSFTLSYAGQHTQQNAEAEQVGEATPMARKKKVKPGEMHCNKDNVCLDNDANSGGNASIDPKDGNANSKTTVDTDTGFEGDISGLDGNDTVDLSSSNNVNVSGTGGLVNVSGGSTVNVSNTGVAGGADIDVTLPSGTTINVGPGSDITIDT